MTTLSTIETEVAGQRLSGRAAEPDGAPRAVVLALHGRSYSSRYFDLRAGQRSSAAFFETCLAPADNHDWS